VVHINRKYLAFDLETAKVQPPDDPRWKEDRPLGISCAATLCCDSSDPLLWYGLTKTNRPARQMSQIDAAKLVKYLSRMASNGYTIVTWNGIGFDFDILAEESRMLAQCRHLALGHVDLMFHVLCQRGFGVSLACAARAMGVAAKGEEINGSMVPRLWAEGRRREVLDYVAQDVRTTLSLATICETKGCLCWATRTGRRNEMPLRRGWLTVCDAQKLPRPRDAWMHSGWSRGKWTAWMR
jgi:hypothetical protein